MQHDASLSEPALRRLFLCADDYGLNESIDTACLELARAGRLSAVSCMTRSPRWDHSARLLEADLSGCKTGLHLDLTEDWKNGSTVFGLGALLARSFLGLIPAKKIASILSAQFDAFENTLGRIPDFVDGHQHIHEFPWIRDIVLTEIQQRYGSAKKKPWIRSTGSTMPSSGLKEQLLDRLGNDDFRKKIRQTGFHTNADFSGVYGFSASSQAYAEQMDAWLSCIRNGAVMMCHPARTAITGDPIGQARLVEYHFLRSDEFGDMLSRRQVVICQELPEG